MSSVTLPEIEVTAVCHDCRRKHVYRVQTADLANATGQWATKHFGHDIEFSQPFPVYAGRWSQWLRDFWSSCPLWAPAGYAYGHNADVKAAYIASADYTITLTSLATSSTRVAGRESLAVNNASSKAVDYLVGGKIRTGSSPTAGKQIDIWGHGAVKDTPTYVDTLTGADANVTLTSENVRNTAAKLVASIILDATSNRPYWLAPNSIGLLFGSIVVPQYHGLFVAQDSTAALDGTGSNHVLSYTPVYGTVT